MKASEYLESILAEVSGNIDYIVNTEGIEIPDVWRDKIIEPMWFAITQQRLGESDDQERKG